MKNPPDKKSLEATLTRRQFIASSTKAAAVATIAASLPRPGYAAEDNTVKIVLVGCGGRGTGAAAQALSTEGPTKLWAMADVFDTRLQSSLDILKKQKPDQVDVPPERQFVGLDAFKKAMDTVDKGCVVLLATPPAFRPIHVEYAVSKSLHIFMEKSFGVDAPGIRRILKCGVEAQKKNLKIATGLRCRHDSAIEEAVQNIHDGMIGEVRTVWAYRMHGPVGLRPRESSWNELAYQIANFAGFTWLNGSFFVDWLIHNIDNCFWIKNALPVSVQGMGGRQVRQDPDQLFDHYSAEYLFSDGTRMVAEGRHSEGCWDNFGVQVEGSTGSAVLGEGVQTPHLFKGFNPTSKNRIWSFTGNTKDAYQVEHDLFFDAIRTDKPYNETEAGAKSNLAAIMGRMACESGQRITWDDAMSSNLELAPGLEGLTVESNPPVLPDANGRYPIAKPGKTIVL